VIIVDTVAGVVSPAASLEESADVEGDDETIEVTRPVR
jgi:hypothetical protein